MTLSEYINQFPRNRRAGIRREIAEAHDVTEIAVRHWANGQRKHPGTLNAVLLTEGITRGLVCRHELRPDIYEPNTMATA